MRRGQEVDGRGGEGDNQTVSTAGQEQGQVQE